MHPFNSFARKVATWIGPDINSLFVGESTIVTSAFTESVTGMQGLILAHVFCYSLKQQHHYTLLECEGDIAWHPAAFKSPRASDFTFGVLNLRNLANPKVVLTLLSAKQNYMCYCTICQWWPVMSVNGQQCTKVTRGKRAFILSAYHPHNFHLCLQPISQRNLLDLKREVAYCCEKCLQHGPSRILAARVDSL